MSVCENHQGIQVEINNLKDRQDRHEDINKEQHTEIWTAINDIRNRLPLWATFLIGGMGTCIGYLLAIAKIIK